MKVINQKVVDSGKTREEVVEEARKYAHNLKALGFGVIEIRNKVQKKFKKFNLKIV